MDREVVGQFVKRHLPYTAVRFDGTEEAVLAIEQVFEDYLAAKGVNTGEKLVIPIGDTVYHVLKGQWMIRLYTGTPLIVDNHDMRMRYENFVDWKLLLTKYMEYVQDVEGFMGWDTPHFASEVIFTEEEKLVLKQIKEQDLC